MSAEGAAEAFSTEPAAQGGGDADTEWPDFEDAEMPEPGAEAAAESGAEAEAAESEPEPVAETEDVISGGAFDLSDIEIPEAVADAMPESGLQMDTTGDMEKTVAITRPKDEIDTGEAAAMFEDETPADEKTIVAEGESEPEATAEGEPEAQPETASGIGTELDLGDLDFDQVDLDQAVASASEDGDDEFSGTISKTLSGMEEDESKEAVPELDLTSELEAAPDGEASKPEEKADDDKNALDLGDVDHDELNNLLDELADEAEKDGDDKKKS